MRAPDRALLERIAAVAMRERGFEPQPPAAAYAEAAAADARETGDGAADLTGLPWTSIDNKATRDLDQLEAVEALPDGRARLRVAIADVAGFVRPGSACDGHARHNTTSVYTTVRTFAMLPERYSYDVTSLRPRVPRRAWVVEATVAADGTLESAACARARVASRAKLDYPSVSDYFAGRIGPPAALKGDKALAEQLHLQEALATRMREARRRAGAFDVGRAEVRAETDARGNIVGLRPHDPDRASRLVEELMIATNRAVVETLRAAGRPSIQRILPVPRDWGPFVALAAREGAALPASPDGRALGAFLDEMRAKKKARFDEIALGVLKLLGHADYVAATAGAPAPVHFTLGTRGYAHATAPNRRFVDVELQRLLAGDDIPVDELAAVAAHASEMERRAQRVERRVHKAIAAALLAPHVGTVYDAVVTGVVDHGTYVRALAPCAEGKLVAGGAGLRVGDKLRVQLTEVDVERSFVDFVAV